MTDELSITWLCKPFDELTNEELYKIIQLRIEVFSIEQNVIYQDCDDKDLNSYHLMAFKNKKLIAYSRLLPIGIAYENATSIGRIVTALSVRRQSLGKELVAKSLENIYKLFGNVPVTISAQLYLQRFYEGFGFIRQSEPYLEDSIPHIKMRLVTEL